ncbi:MAG TPA: very short patch repair endonuclease [Allosphingosinicella sp.]
MRSLPALRRATEPDRLTREARSRNMSRIRGRDTKPELLVRRLLHRAGFRYRLHQRTLPGRPDLVLPRWRAVLFVHGCFWHAHDCPNGVLPATRREFWTRKLSATRSRDHEQARLLLDGGWRVGTVWECAIVGRGQWSAAELLYELGSWLAGEEAHLEVRGRL